MTKKKFMDLSTSLLPSDELAKFAESLFHLLDSDHNSFLDWEEFSSAATKFSSTERKNRLLRILQNITEQNCEENVEDMLYNLLEMENEVTSMNTTWKFQVDT